MDNLKRCPNVCGWRLCDCKDNYCAAQDAFINKLSPQIQSVHVVDGKKVLVLKEKENLYTPKKKKLKAKNYFNKLKNSK